MCTYFVRAVPVANMDYLRILCLCTFFQVLKTSTNLQDRFSVSCFAGYESYVVVRFNGTATAIYPSLKAQPLCHGSQDINGIWLLEDLGRPECESKFKYGAWSGKVIVQLGTVPSPNDPSFKYSCTGKFKGPFISHTIHAGSLVDGHFMLKVLNVSGQETTSAMIGAILRLEVTFQPGIGEVNFSVISCKVADKFPFPTISYDIVIGGCGTNGVIPYNKGFYIFLHNGGPLGLSFPFRAFRLGSWDSIQYMCYFVICDNSISCAGPSCKGDGPRKRRQLPRGDFYPVTSQTIRIEDMPNAPHMIPLVDAGQIANGEQSLTNGNPGESANTSPGQRSSGTQDWALLIAAILLLLILMIIALLACTLCAIFQLVKKRSSLIQSRQTTPFIDISDDPTSGTDVSDEPLSVADGAVVNTTSRASNIHSDTFPVEVLHRNMSPPPDGSRPQQIASFISDSYHSTKNSTLDDNRGNAHGRKKNSANAKPDERMIENLRSFHQSRTSSMLGSPVRHDQPASPNHNLTQKTFILSSPSVSSHVSYHNQPSMSKTYNAHYASESEREKNLNYFKPNESAVDRLRSFLRSFTSSRSGSSGSHDQSLSQNNNQTTKTFILPRPSVSSPVSYHTEPSMSEKYGSYSASEKSLISQGTSYDDALSESDKVSGAFKPRSVSSPIKSDIPEIFFRKAPRSDLSSGSKSLYDPYTDSREAREKFHSRAHNISAPPKLKGSGKSATHESSMVHESREKWWPKDRDQRKILASIESEMRANKGALERTSVTNKTYVVRNPHAGDTRDTAPQNLNEKHESGLGDPNISGKQMDTEAEAEPYKGRSRSHSGTKSLTVSIEDDQCYSFATSKKSDLSFAKSDASDKSILVIGDEGHAFETNDEQSWDAFMY